MPVFHLFFGGKGPVRKIQHPVSAWADTSDTDKWSEMFKIFFQGYLTLGLLATGEIWQFIAFIQRHPGVLWEVLYLLLLLLLFASCPRFTASVHSTIQPPPPQLASFSVASALGQFFIFMCVSDFGPLPCSIITTTRSASCPKESVRKPNTQKSSKLGG